MSQIETYYLIDYENVNGSGLEGCGKLTASDHIIIFFTKNAVKINMSDISDHGNAELKMIEISPGKQSVDMHIGSYLGYLIGINSGKGCRIAIISGDMDFDNMLKFWKDKNNADLSRAVNIKEHLSSIKKKKAAPDKSAPEECESQKTKINNEIMQTLGKAGFGSEVTGFVASTAVKNIGVKNKKQQIYRAVLSKFGQSRGLDIYNRIKKFI